jgi:hypothetical protein
MFCTISGVHRHLMRAARPIARQRRLNDNGLLLPFQLSLGLQALSRRGMINGPSQPSPDPNPMPVDGEVPEDSPFTSKKRWQGTAFKMSEAALTTFASIAILG